MNILTMVLVLFKIKWLSPKGLFLLLEALWKEGINVMLLLRVAARFHGEKTALADDNETVDYKQLFIRSSTLSYHFSEKYEMKKGQKIGFLCRNHASFVTAVFAASRLGADLYLLNTEAGRSRVHEIVQHHAFDFLIFDEEFSSCVDQSSHAAHKILSYHDHLTSIDHLIKTSVNEKRTLSRSTSGKIVLLTGGTTGKPKEAAHTPSIFAYLGAFFTLVNRLNLQHRQTAYIATPLFHGYGLAILFSMITLGKKVVISREFKAEKACGLIKDHHVDVVTVVPLMLHKMLDWNVKDLTSLVCIASGGAELNPKLTQSVFDQLGMVLYNLYGTSEGGLHTIASPNDLACSSRTIGRKIHGIQLNILDDAGRIMTSGEIGQLCIKKKNTWIKTGDVGWRDANEYYYLCGRTDDMIVSAGENVYPLDIERVLSHHPAVDCTAVIGISDERFGQRLAAFIQPVPNTALTKEKLLNWLRPQVARFQMPKEIIFVQRMPHTSLGKLDKNQLREHLSRRNREEEPPH